jgi:hypothetical protein
MRKITCYCENIFEKEIADSFDLDKNPELLKEIMNGNFLSIKCPECGTVLKPEFPIQIIKKTDNINIFFIPELDRNNYFLKKLDYSVPDSDRVTIGYKELVEKVSIFTSGMDDQIIEFLKYQILGKFINSEDYNEEIQIYFKEVKDNILFFYIENLKPDEIGVFKLPQNIYNKADITSKINTEPYNIFLTPPYVSVNRIIKETSL